MPRKTIKSLEEEILVLRSRLKWIEGVNASTVNMLRDTTHFFTEIKTNLSLVIGTVENAEMVTQKTLADIEEALNARRKGTRN